MSTTLLQTKLYVPPTQPFLLSRPRLVEQLDANSSTSRLTLVSAPAGFGKTTLIAEWIRSRQEAHGAGKDEGTVFGWFSLDEADNDPVLFWSYVLAALQRAGVPSGRQLLTLLSAPSPPLLTTVITHLLNDLRIYEGRIVLVLDDYHVIDEGAIHEQVAFLLERLPSQLHLVLLTRADPPLPLPRWRARREMAEVRQADLRFERPEANQLLNELLSLDLSAEDVAVLDERTEGWVAGLQMAALALGQRDVDRQAFIDSFAGSHFYIMTYLVDEVLRQQPQEVQQFLQQTAVLRRMCAPLCTAVTGNVDSGPLLQEVYRQNLFLIPLDEDHDWYRTHRLFADLLVTRLEQNSSATEIQALHHRAAEWYEENNFLEEAIYHALRCGDMAWTAGLVEKHARPVMQQGRLTTLLRWIDVLDPEELAKRPRLQIDQAWSLFLSGDASRTKDILLATRRSLQEEPHLVQDDAVRGELAALMANCASMEEDVERVMAEVEEALAYLPPDDADLQSVVFRARALNAAGEARFHQGRLREAEAANRQIIELAESQGAEPGKLNRAVLPPYAGMGYIGLAAVQLERYQLQAAAQSLEQGLALSGQGGIGYKHLDAFCTMARLRGTEGNVAGAVAALEQAEAYAPLPLHKLQLASFAVRFWLGQGDLAMAQRWLHRLVPQRVPVVVGEVMDMTRARIALVEGDWDRVLALFDTVVASAERPPASRMARVVEMALLKALALEAMGEGQPALESLGKAVDLAAPERAMLTFLELGPGLAVLLRALKDQGRSLQPYTDQLLRLFPATADSQAGLVESLSARELEVLRHIAGGKSNKEIAAALTVTLNTVKKHSSHIYGKLGVNGRTQAVACARELDLL